MMSVYGIAGVNNEDKQEDLSKKDADLNRKKIQKSENSQKTSGRA